MTRMPGNIWGAFCLIILAFSNLSVLTSVADVTHSHRNNVLIGPGESPVAFIDSFVKLHNFANFANFVLILVALSLYFMRADMNCVK